MRKNHIVNITHRFYIYSVWTADGAYQVDNWPVIELVGLKFCRTFTQVDGFRITLDRNNMGSISNPPVDRHYITRDYFLVAYPYNARLTLGNENLR
nr:hypothetical protein [Commensalibacter melissae]